MPNVRITFPSESKEFSKFGVELCVEVEKIPDIISQIKKKKNVTTRDLELLAQLEELLRLLEK
jgi:hypothetical protein